MLIPAIKILFLLVLDKKDGFFDRLYIHKKPLARSILQKASVKAGTVATYLMTSDVELTDIKAMVSKR
mgnify:FL=1